MMGYSAWLEEMAIAVPGDWVPKKSILGTVTWQGIDVYWPLIKEVVVNGHSYDVRAHKNGSEVIIGTWGTSNKSMKDGPANQEVFLELGKMIYSKVGSLKGLYERPIQIQAVEVNDVKRARGFATALYKTVCENSATIIGDEKQYFGARKLWARLSKELNLQVDIINIKRKIVVYEDVILHQGQYNVDFDERIWSYNEDKSDLRTVLRKIL